MLLQWCTLEPSGPSQLAALRFASPVRIHSISIFPTDYQPFSNNPDLVGRTEPKAFFLELYFNAHPISHSNAREKPKPTNALIPTVLAYAGGCMQFPVNMSSETSTRLMVVKGSFESVSMAIYGDIVAELSPPSSTYEPKQIPSADPIPLHASLDPSSFRDPSKLSEQLLQLIPDSPPLLLTVRLMYCLKPAGEDWDLPDFPFLYSDLAEFTETSELEDACSVTSRSVADDAPRETLEVFAQRVAGSLTPKTNNQAFDISKILGHVACQHPELARVLLENLDFATIFDSSNLDEDTLDRLLDATANPDIARAFNAPWFLDILVSVARSSSSGKELRTLAKRLVARIEGMAALEDAIVNTQGDFNTAAMAIKDIGTQECSFGTWLANMISHPDLVDKLSENPPLSSPGQVPPQLFKDSKVQVQHDEFIAFLRAVIGVASVLAVWSWADSLPDRYCRERTLSIIRLWQGVDGYREILNHFLLLPQMMFRLECMLENDLPTKAGIYAEKILLDLAKDPHAILKPKLAHCIFSLRPPHCVITIEDRHSMIEAAEIADDGLPGAIDYIVQELGHPLTRRSTRALRVALAVIAQELTEQGERLVLDEFWTKGGSSIQTYLADAYIDLNEEICRHFSVHPTGSSSSSEFIAELFQASDQAIGILLRLVPNYPLPGRVTRAIIASCADLFVCVDIIDSAYTQTSLTCIAAQQTRQSCIDVVRSLAEAPPETKDGRSNEEVVLRTLLEHGFKNGDREPAHHLLQAFCLIDYLLPMPDDVADDSVPNKWTQSVLPSMLRELWAFCVVLDTENKAHFVRRLVGLDRDIIGIGDWLLQQEMKDLLKTLEELTLDDGEGPGLKKLMREYQASLSVRFLLDLVSSSSTVSSWCTHSLVSNPESAHSLALCLDKLSEHNLVSSHLTKLVHTLSVEPANLDDEVKLPLALALLRTSQYGQVTSSDITSSLYLAHTILLTVPSHLVKAENVAHELGAILSLLSQSEHLLEGNVSDALLGVLEWLDSSDNPAALTIHGISLAAFTSLLPKFRETLAADRHPFLDSIQPRLRFPDQDQDLVKGRPSTLLPDKAELSLQDLEDLLRIPTPPPSTPPRRFLNQDVLGTVAISPPTAVIRSPAATGLTKTYLNNDFRQLRQAPSARQNTSRLPSMHVDDFENAAGSPTLLSLPMPVPIPLAGTSTMPFAAATPATLSPVFKLL